MHHHPICRSSLSTLLWLALTLSSFSALVGCSSYRLVLEPYDGRRTLTETVVLTDDHASRGTTGPKIALISYEGLIALGGQSSLLGAGKNPISDFVEALNKARLDSHVKAVVLYINSPGGTVTASDILYRELKRFKGKSSKPVVVLMGDVAASGGYYLACAGDQIIAHPTTITGSIGVIIQTVNISQGLAKLGITANSITSGPNKNMGSPFEAAQAEHRKLFQEMVDEFYQRFVAVVVENRPALSAENLPAATDGRVVTGIQAAEIGLVDQTGYLIDAFKAAKLKANLKQAKLVTYHRPGEFVATAYSTAYVQTDQNPESNQHNTTGLNLNFLQLNAFNGTNGWTPQPGPMAYYLWSPNL